MLATFAKLLVVIAIIAALFGIWGPAILLLALIFGVWLLTEVGVLPPEFGK